MDLTANINYFAVLVAALINMALGFYWYSQSGFGKPWMEAMGYGKITKEKLAKMKKDGMKDMPKTVIVAFISALIMNYVLALFMNYLGAVTFMDGIKVGVLAWVGFLATTMIGDVLWEKRPFKLFAINSGFYLVLWIINGGLLAVWR